MASYGVSGLQFVTRRGVRALIGQAGGIVIALLVAFSLVALATAAAMLAAAAAADVQRRLPSIGVLRAVGASARGIVLTFASEAALVGAPAAAVGIFLGWLVAAGPTARLLLSLNELPPGPSLAGLLAAALAAIVLLVAAASAWPAWRACRRSPVEALRGADVVSVTRAAPVVPGPAGLGLRLALARPLRTAAVGAVLALSASVVLLILAIATLLARLHATPAAVGKRYELAVSAPASAANRIARTPGVAGVTPLWSVDAADSFDLGEPFTLVAYGSASTRDVPGNPRLPVLKLLARLTLWNVLPNRRRATFFNLWAGARKRERYRAQLRDDLGEVLRLLHDGAITPQIARRFALRDAGEALRYAEQGGIVGKVVLEPEADATSRG